MDCIKRIQDLIYLEREEVLFKSIKNELIKTLSKRGCYFTNQEDLYEFLRNRVEVITFSNNCFGQTKYYLLDRYDELFSITETNKITSFENPLAVSAELSYKITFPIKPSTEECERTN